VENKVPTFFFYSTVTSTYLESFEHSGDKTSNCKNRKSFAAKKLLSVSSRFNDEVTKNTALNFLTTLLANQTGTTLFAMLPMRKP